MWSVMPSWEMLRMAAIYTLRYCYDKKIMISVGDYFFQNLKRKSNIFNFPNSNNFIEKIKIIIYCESANIGYNVLTE